ncbi:hypothetical protein FRX31_004280 [Thalictrum thalictroides]|uniref:Uncharacterized protein n=1 Tax=Thalictrum thalictroides TaxID=46969 RepID=A0A7J6XCM3_THATH|nr:hypothetical protein FRX31_004280 [Thalictrum thalictroides]
MGIPCEHVVIAIVDTGFDPYGYCVEYYFKDIYMQTYKEDWVPIGGKETWPKSHIPMAIRPPHITAPGRPSKKKKRGKVECIHVHSRCRVRGHNKATCKVVVDDNIYCNNPAQEGSFGEWEDITI